MSLIPLPIIILCIEIFVQKDNSGLIYMTSPRIIALCGNPEAGKSEVQKILVERYGAIAIDDGWPMRDFAIRHLGLSYEDVTTQDGKAKIIELYGRKFTVRQLLGEFGNKLEELFGDDVLALMSAQYLSSLGSGRLYCAG
jgi:dephospho-CoA kinase